MGVDFSTMVYLPAFDMFARPIIVTPRTSQAGGSPYMNRGIYHSDTTSYLAENNTIISDQQTTLDIRQEEFAILPMKDDIIDIPNDDSVPAAGNFIVTNIWNNGGGEFTLQLRKLTDQMQMPPDA